jgi:beta-phosphoglucomutase-like phosphatase (HAD superfamily)
MAGLEVVVLDCDGVILESVAVKTEAFGKLFQEHGPEASKKMVAYHLAHGGVSRFEKFAWFYQEVLGRALVDSDRHRLNKRFTDLCLEGVLNASFVPGRAPPTKNLKLFLAKRIYPAFFRESMAPPRQRTGFWQRSFGNTG